MSLLRKLATKSPLVFHSRHLYALYCLLLRELKTDSDASNKSSGASALPEIFRDNGWSTLGTSILSTSNCGNPALRLFGFGPVAADGYGLGYIIKDDGLSVCAASKHLQTRRFLDTLQGYLEEVQRVLVALVRAANERPEPFVDHAGVLRDSKTGRRINGSMSDDEEDADSIRASSVLPLWKWKGMTYYHCTQPRILFSTVMMSSSLGGRESGRTHTPLVSLFSSGSLDEPTKPFSLQEKLSRWWSIEEICKNGTRMILYIVITIMYESKKSNGTAVQRSTVNVQHLFSLCSSRPPGPG